MAGVVLPQNGPSPAGVDKTQDESNASTHGGSTETDLILVDASPTSQPQTNNKSRLLKWVVLWPFTVSLTAMGIAIFLRPFSLTPSIEPQDYTARTEHVLSTSPLIDGHNDLPYLIRVELKNHIYPERFTFDQGLLSHTDMKKMRQGMMGGQFWSIYMPCSEVEGIEIDDPTWSVRDTLEQIDVAKRFINEYPKVFQYCETAACARAAFKSGKIASMLGIEGGHLVGNSLASLRQMYELGARYLTTTHNCDNAFGTAWNTVSTGGKDFGLTPFGHEYVKEMNRLGMMIDLSHVSQQTMRDVLGASSAPVIFSHSSAYGVNPHLRNVPDDVLRSVKQNGGIVMVNFLTRFLNMKNPELATVHDVVDHIMHIVGIAGWEHIGLGSDFDGTPEMPRGLEDVSKYPQLIALVMERGATDEQIRLLVGENILRVWEEVEEVGRSIQLMGTKPNEETWEGRKWWRSNRDLPCMFRDSRGIRIPGLTID